MTTSLGVIETRGLISAIHAADAACKSAAVTLVGCKKIGSGLVSVMFHGEISAVSAAVESGVDAAQQVEASLVIARPDTSVLAMLENEPSSTPKPPEEGCSEHSSEPAESAKAPSDDKPAAKRSARTRKQGPRK